MGRKKSIFSLFKKPRRTSLFPKKRRSRSIFGKSRKSNPLNSITRFLEAIVKLLNIFKSFKK